MNEVRRTVLSDDEIRVLRLMAEGETVPVVARRLDMSERTVRRKARSACDKLACDSTIEAIVWAVRNRLF
ncbi:response regulator transcription factor [Nocardioides xinjiangensis]|uniref:response regulator transcription factor n=1 Tax=Nocardioides xinjiangensis TaxID=2817376 RepID=UPI001B30FB4D|nr:MULTISPECIES: LuxR C-terminal-related transcriptional regulator [unclassified Nocardioides]